MYLYRLNITPFDSAGAGEVWDEWFGSLVAAKKQRMYYIKKDPDVSYCGRNYSIDRVEIPTWITAQSKRQMLIAALNALGQWPNTEVVPDWEPKEEIEEESEV